MRFSNAPRLAAVLDLPNVDTDLLVPKQFLTRLGRTGFGEALLFNLRYLKDGSENPDFPLNWPRYKGAQILVSRENFGCGSSREHAAWALEDYGFQILISPKFADIFKNNCARIGLVLIELESNIIDNLINTINNTYYYTLSIDIEKQTILGSDGFFYKFNFDQSIKYMILNGLDEIDITISLEEKIRKYELENDLFNNNLNSKY